MKTKLSTIITTVILFFLTAAASAQTNFSGTWKRNNEKTDAGGLSINSVVSTMQITQDSNTLTIKGTNKNSNGEELSSYTDVLKLDGTPSERITNANQKKQMSVKWSVDKKQLTQSSIYKDEQRNVVQTVKLTFNLSEDGKMLRVLDERNFDEKSFQLQDVFDKQ